MLLEEQVQFSSWQWNEYMPECIPSEQRKHSKRLCRDHESFLLSQLRHQEKWYHLCQARKREFGMINQQGDQEKVHSCISTTSFEREDRRSDRRDEWQQRYPKESSKKRRSQVWSQIGRKAARIWRYKSRVYRHCEGKVSWEKGLKWRMGSQRIDSKGRRQRRKYQEGTERRHWNGGWDERTERMKG